MSLKSIPVYASEIEVDKVVVDLMMHGIVVLETSRTHATQIKSDALDRLGIDPESEHSPFLLHLSFEVADRGWVECLMYSESANYEPEELRDITNQAIQDWIAGGGKPYHIFRKQT